MSFSAVKIAQAAAQAPSVPAHTWASLVSTQTPFALVKEAADNGNAKAQYELALRFSLGQGAPQDETQAFKWALKAAEQTHVAGQLRAADAYFFGKGITQDLAKAIGWYRSAADTGNVEAQFSLGVCYGKAGNGIDAMTWFRKAASADDAWAIHNVTVFDTTNRNVQPDLNQLRKAAEGGVPAAQYNLGTCLEHGIGTDPNAREAVNWYRKAALQGHDIAQNNLGHCYITAHGIGRDEKEGVKWFLSAATRGLAQAQYTVGVCYYFGGYGIRWNQEEGAKWLRLAAGKRHAEAVPLSRAVEIQRTVNPDPVFNPFLTEETRQLLRRQMSAKQFQEASNREALREANKPELPLSYSASLSVLDTAWAGKPTPVPGPNLKSLLASIKSRASQGSGDAQLELGIRYLKGDGVENDTAQAALWLSAAATNEQLRAQQLLKERAGERLP